MRLVEKINGARLPEMREKISRSRSADAEKRCEIALKDFEAKQRHAKIVKDKQAIVF